MARDIGCRVPGSLLLLTSSDVKGVVLYVSSVGKESAVVKMMVVCYSTGLMEAFLEKQ